MKQRAICLFMVFMLAVGACMPKKAYAVAGVDDAAVVIVCALLAAAGVTFASNDGVQDAVKGFLDASAGKYDSTIERLASGYNVYGSVGAFKIPAMAMGGVRLLLEGLFDYFDTDEDRQGIIVVPSGSSYNFAPSFSSPVPSTTTPIYSKYCLWGYYNGNGKYTYYFFVPSNDYKVNQLIDCFKFSDGSFSWYAAWGGRATMDEYEKMYFLETSNWLEVHGPRSTFTLNWFSLNRDDYASNAYAGGFNAFDGVTYYAGDYSGAFSAYKNFFDNSYDTLLPSYCYSGYVDKSIPYGLTFPQELTAPDVIDNFEQRVEEAAGDLAIVVPVDGVVDNTLPYAEAQEQYLANVNELGEITDTVTETNSWLQQILISVKALPAAISTSVIGMGELDLSGFQGLALTSVFPFCIPFDFVNCIRYFVVPESVPVWTVNLSGSPLAAFGTFEINFERFSVWAKIIKFFLYSIFVVGLVKLTRHLIKG